MTKTTDSNINIIGNKLIISLPSAQMPVVWQMDLEQAQSASFTIKEDKKAKSFALISKIQNEEASEIARFSDKQVSVDILMEISNALQNAPVQTNIVSSNPEAATIKSKSKDNKIGAILSLSLVLILIIIWVLSASKNLNNVEYKNSVSSSAPSSSSGVAISADDFLNNR